MPAVIRKFVEWLSYHPTTEEIGRALATDYLAEFAVRSLRFGRLNSDDSITNLGQFGFPDADEYRNRNIPSDEWRAYKSAEIAIISGASKEKWAPDGATYVNTLRDRGVLQGHLIVTFHNPVPAGDKHRVAEVIDDLCVPLALYLSFMSRPVRVGLGGVTLPTDTWESGSAQLSQRQILILRGMVEGKTNHELATELGFSVSTIRHETMRIYQALGVSDRKEAAKKALMLSLV
jgi:DNA-binding CsgD family transcriptional regulator